MTEEASSHSNSLLTKHAAMITALDVMIDVEWKCHEAYRRAAKSYEKPLPINY